MQTCHHSHRAWTEAGESRDPVGCGLRKSACEGCFLQAWTSHVCTRATKRQRRRSKPVHVALVGLLPVLRETVCVHAQGCEPVARPMNVLFVNTR